MTDKNGSPGDPAAEQERAAAHVAAAAELEAESATVIDFQVCELAVEYSAVYLCMHDFLKQADLEGQLQSSWPLPYISQKLTEVQWLQGLKL